MRHEPVSEHSEGIALPGRLAVLVNRLQIPVLVDPLAVLVVPTMQCAPIVGDVTLGSAEATIGRGIRSPDVPGESDGGEEGNEQAQGSHHRERTTGPIALVCIQPPCHHLPSARWPTN